MPQSPEPSRGPRMKMYGVVTPSHRGLFEQFFLPSLDQEQFEVHALDLAVEGRGDFLADDFKAAIRFKLDSIIESIQENTGDIVIWTDVDIQFYGLRSDHVRRYMEPPEQDFAAQRLHLDQDVVCGGFYAIRCSPRMRSFFERVREVTAQEMDGNEQEAINVMLKRDPIRWRLMGPEFYARNHGIHVPPNAVLHHATCVVPGDSVQQKIRMLTHLRDFQKWGVTSRISHYLREAPNAAARILKIQSSKLLAS